MPQINLKASRNHLQYSKADMQASDLSLDAEMLRLLTQAAMKEA